MPSKAKSLEKADEQTLFYEMYEQYNKLVYSLAFERLKNHTLAEECVQDTFMVVIKKIEAFKDISDKHRKNLICTIARGKAIDRIRKENITFAAFSKAEVVDISYFDGFDVVEISEQLEKLNEKEQVYVYLKYAYGFSNKEIAKMYKQSASYVGRIINNALTKIKKELEESNE